jgi:hypothetical protein
MNGIAPCETAQHIITELFVDFQESKTLEVVAHADVHRSEGHDLNHLL